MGFVVCLEVGTVFVPAAAPVVVVLLVFMVVISVCKDSEMISGFYRIYGTCERGPGAFEGLGRGLYTYITAI
jgi:hypothetical protein